MKPQPASPGNPPRPTTAINPAVAGFTLIELVITVAIVAILMTIAIASYDFATVKTRRGAAKACLLQDAQYMERFYTTNMAYDKDTGGTGVALPGCDTNVSNFYDVSFVTGEPTASTFGLQAVPKGAQLSSDTLCGTMTVDNVGTKTASGSGGVTSCW